MENVESLCGSVFAECFDLRRDEERKVPNVRYMSVDFHHVPRMTGFFDSVDILSLMKRVFGLNVVRNETDVRQKCSFHVLKHCSIPWLLYALFMHVLHLAIFISTVSFGCTYKVSVLDFGLSMMFTLVSVLSMLVTIIWCLKNTARLRKLKTSIAGFDQKFKMLGSNVDNNLIRDFTICEAVVVLLFWTGFFVYYVFWSCDYGTWKCFVNWFVNYHPHKVLLVAFVEEIALLYGLTVRFRCLNEMLLNLEMDVVVDLRIKPRVSSTQRRCFGCVKLVHCRQLHYLLCDLCYDLNDMLSLQTVFNILDCFVNIFVMLYLACFGYTRDAENSGINYDTLGIFLPVFVGGEAFLKIFYLAKYCDSVQSEAKRTGEILHKISMYSLNDSIKNEILHFSHQLLFKNVNITACGMFPIDFSLLYNVIAAVTTFIVILIQFAMAIKYAPSTTVSTAMNDFTDKYDSVQ